MGENGKVQEYLKSAEEWLKAAKSSLKSAPEPAAFNALHSAELAAKAALVMKTGEEHKTHNVGGEFGKHFRDRVGNQVCRELSRKMMRYSKLRYPDEEVGEDEAREIIKFSEEFLGTVKALLEVNGL